ncbi:MAG: ABC transporter permease [Lachnospiraceae bacterium]|jgi:simple sugar transport system permease protein|nr:ABC transporter permease [Lachnospiraceae bacterium]MCI8994370.1 ABC transporter permease [Lachnospiraceae bacterium]MCI9132945.1 ABC transporter permease [Lachnospiraceae bacterium]
MNKATLKRMTRRTEFWIFLVLVIMCIAIQTISGGQLFKSSTMVTIFRSMVVDGMFAMCCLVVMVSGGFDLSFPAVAALAYSLATTICVNMGWCTTNPIAGLVLATVIGFVLGMLNGWIISNFKLNTMIVTLGTQTFFTGVSMGLLQMQEITSTLPAGFRAMGESYLFEVYNAAGIRSTMTTMFLFFIALAAITSFVLNHTMFGRALYAIGGNEVSAERAGYNVKRVKFILYSVVGAVSGFIGMIRVCMERQSIPKAMVGREMTIIPAVILGGASIFGGEGSVFGTVCAIGIITVVSNSMLLIGIDTYWQSFFNGLVILIGITVSAVQAMRQRR